MMKTLVCLLTLVSVLTVPSVAGAEQAILGAMRDNTIYREAVGDNANSNGVGDHFAAGTQGSVSALRRGLVAFDLSGLPSPIQVDRVALELTFQGATNMEQQSRVVSLHRLLADWGEGTSNAGPGGSSGSGNGAPATPGDATWRYRFFNTQTWASFNPAVPSSGGGDSANDLSASATVGLVPNVVVTWETVRGGMPTGLVADVEAWLANPISNFGWLLKGDESVARTVRRFYSKDDANAAFHPRLVVDYTVVPEPATLTMLALGALSRMAVPQKLRRQACQRTSKRTTEVTFSLKS
jgi:hypothetical protein